MITKTHLLQGNWLWLPSPSQEGKELKCPLELAALINLGQLPRSHEAQLTATLSWISLPWTLEEKVSKGVQFWFGPPPSPGRDS